MVTKTDILTGTKYDIDISTLNVIELLNYAKELEDLICSTRWEFISKMQISLRLIDTRLRIKKLEKENESLHESKDKDQK